MTASPGSWSIIQHGIPLISKARAPASGVTNDSSEIIGWANRQDVWVALGSKALANPEMAWLGQMFQRAPISPDALEAVLPKSIMLTAPDLSIWQNVVPVPGTSPLIRHGVSQQDLNHGQKRT